MGGCGDIEPKVACPRIAFGDGVGEYFEHGVGFRVVITGTRAGEVSDLHGGVGNEREQVLDKRACLFGAVRAVL